MSPSSSSSAVPPARRRRWRWLLPLLILPLIAFLLLRWVLQPERLGALLLERASAASGLELTVAEPARLGIWPGLQLELLGLTARLPGRPPLLQAQRVDVALPLAVLWQREVELGELALRSPRLDLGELQHWRDRDLDAGPPEPPALPGFAAALAVRDGELVLADGALRGIDLDASPLRDGAPFDATVVMVLHSGERELPLRLQLALLPRQQAEGIALGSIRLELGAGGETSVRSEGSATLDAAARIEATMQVQVAGQWPEQWPALPAQAWPQLAGRSFRLEYHGALDLDGKLELHSDQPEPLRASANPRGLLDWLGADAASPLPPLDAAIELERLELDGTIIEGLRIELRDDAAGSTTPAATDDAAGTAHEPAGADAAGKKAAAPTEADDD